jgi:hypothetical protein
MLRLVHLWPRGRPRDLGQARPGRLHGCVRLPFLLTRHIVPEHRDFLTCGHTVPSFDKQLLDGAGELRSNGSLLNTPYSCAACNGLGERNEPGMSDQHLPRATDEQQNRCGCDQEAEEHHPARPSTRAYALSHLISSAQAFGP